MMPPDHGGEPALVPYDYGDGVLRSNYAPRQIALDTTPMRMPSYGFVWPPCCDLIRVKVGWRFRTQRVGEERRMRVWWVPTRRMATAVAKRWVEKEGRRGR